MSRIKDFIILILTAVSSYLMGLLSYKLLLDITFKFMDEEREERRKTFKSFREI